MPVVYRRRRLPITRALVARACFAPALSRPDRMREWCCHAAMSISWLRESVHARTEAYRAGIAAFQAGEEGNRAGSVVAGGDFTPSTANLLVVVILDSCGLIARGFAPCPATHHVDPMLCPRLDKSWPFRWMIWGAREAKRADCGGLGGHQAYHKWLPDGRETPWSLICLTKHSTANTRRSQCHAAPTPHANCNLLDSGKRSRMSRRPGVAQIPTFFTIC